jgi:type IV secretion system protein VirB1
VLVAEGLLSFFKNLLRIPNVSLCDPSLPLSEGRKRMWGFLALLDLLSLLQTCAPEVAPETMAALVRVESGENPFAIGVVGARLKKQPASLEEAVAAAKRLEELGKNFSVGLAQINKKNLPALGLTTYEKAFDPCENLRAGSKILADCYRRAAKTALPARALTDALSCYYSGNTTRGYQAEPGGGPSYVARVLAAVTPLASHVVPALPIGAAAPLPLAPATSPRPAPAPLLLPRVRCSGVVLDASCVATAPPADLPPGPERKEVKTLSPIVF